jgi:hypothetical protein
MISPEYFLKAMELVASATLILPLPLPLPRPPTPAPTPTPHQVAKAGGVNLVYANQQFFYESKWQWNVPEPRVQP